MKTIFLTIIATFIFLTVNAVTTYTVTKKTDVDPYKYPYFFDDNKCDPQMYGTLQWAIRKSLETPDECLIVFNISGTGPFTIQLNYTLPTLEKKPITIDATTQPGYSQGNPQIIIDGSFKQITGLYFNNIKSSGVKGIYFKRFISQALLFNYSSQSFVNSCFFTEIGSLDSRIIQSAIRFTNTSNCEIKGNRIGISPNGNELGNLGCGVLLTDGSSNNFIGGILQDDGNYIVKNQRIGIWVSTKSFYNKISGNIIYNSERAILLEPDGNQQKPAPEINSFNGIEVTGTSHSDDVIEIFGSNGNQSANEYLGTTVTNANGEWIINNIQTNYEYLIATATDINNNTSVLSASYLIPDPCILNPLTVEAGFDTTIQVGESLQIGDNPITGVSYSWTPVNGLNNLDVSNPIASPNVTTIYYVHAKNIYGCVSIDSIKVAISDEVELDSVENPELRYIYEFEITKDPALGYPPTERMSFVRSIIDQSLQNRAAIQDMTWNERGPSNVGGRTRAIMFDPNDVSHKKVWAGGVNGGIWWTDDITAISPVWNHVNDFWDNLTISCIAFDPQNSQNFYIGTGEGWYNIDFVRGAGIWKSSDGGNTWAQLPSTNNSDFFFVQKIVVNSNGIIYAATRNNGVCRSSDGGTSWVKVLGNITGGGSTDRSSDIEIGADGTIYASLGIMSTDGIYSSTNGTVWTKLNIGTNGFPTTGFQRIEIATSPSNANILYAMVQNTNGSLLNIYSSINKGATWTTCTLPSWYDQNCTSPSNDMTRGQAWYDLIMSVDPNNSNTIFTGGIDIMKSTDAGISWSQISSWNPPNGLCGRPYVHADQHGIVFQQGSSNNILFSNDGGLYFTNNGTNASPTITNKNTGYNVTQFYSCAMNPTTASNNFLAGAQDNGTQRFTTSGINVTNDVTGGDGMFCFIDNETPNLQIGSYVWDNFRRSTNGGVSFLGIMGGFHIYMGCLASTFFVNPVDYDSRENTLYFASYSPDFYCGYPGLAKIINVDGTPSNRIQMTINNFNNPPTLFAGDVSFVKVSPYAPVGTSTLFIGTNYGHIFRIPNAEGANPTATDISIPVMLPNYARISCIEIGENENDLLVTFSNYGVTSVWKTSDGGVTWVNKEGNLPDMPVRWALYDPNDRRNVLLATEAGVWSTDDINANTVVWGFDINSGFPRVRVDMLKTRASDNQVIAATHGRGLFSSCVFNHPIANFNVDPCLNATFTDLSTNNPTSWLWDFGDGATSTQQNPLHSYSSPGNYQVTLEASNSCGPSRNIVKNIFIYPDCCGSPSNIAYDDNNSLLNSPITTSVIWNNSYNNFKINKTIVVRAPAILTIQSGVTIEFGPLGKIIIENGTSSVAGAQLIMQTNSKFTSITNSNSSCHVMWQGVEIWGIYDNSSSNSLGQGKITMSQGATIENAHIGVLLGKTNICYPPPPPCPNPPCIEPLPCSPWDLSHGGRSGGIIIANGAIFNNNAVSIRFLPYIKNNTSRIQSCTFTAATLLDLGYKTGNSYTYPNNYNRYYAPNNTGGMGAWHTHLWKVNNVKFYDNTFNTVWAEAILAFDSRLSVNKLTSTYGNVFNNSNYPYSPYYPYSNYPVGVHIVNTTPSPSYFHEIRSNYFGNSTSIPHNCIQIEGNQGSDLIVGNKFNYFTSYPAPYTHAGGVYLTNSSGFSVYDNYFNMLDVGLTVTNSGIGGGNIGFPGGNTFTKCRHSVYTMGSYLGPNSGNPNLQIQCNNFDNPYSLYYTTNTSYNIQSNDNISDQGAYPANYTEDKKPAGNEFLQVQGSLPNTSYRNDIISLDDSYTYYRHHRDINGGWRILPNPVGSGSTVIGVVENSLVNKTVTSCYNDPCLPPCSITLLNTQFAQLQNLKQEFNNVSANLDKGQTLQLITEINNNTSSGQLKNMLINNSPLSDDVLLAFINRQISTPPGIFKEAITPNMPASDVVNNALLLKLNTVPLGIANQIKNLQGYNPDYRTLTSILREINTIENQRAQTLSQTISYYAQNDSLSSLASLLENEHTDYANQLLAGLYIADNNLSLASSKLNSLPNSTLAEQAFININNMLINLALEEKSVFEMDNLQEQLVRQIATMNSSCLARSNARAILLLVYNERYDEEIPQMNSARIASNNENNIDLINSETGFSIYPNPASENIELNYSLSDKENGILEIFSIIGNKIISYVLPSDKAQVNISVKTLDNGIYMYRFIVDGESIEEGKLIIIDK